MADVNYKPYTLITLPPITGLPEREVPQFCAMGPVHSAPLGPDGRSEQYPTPHYFLPTYNPVDGPGAQCAYCLLALAANDLDRFHKAVYGFKPAVVAQEAE